MNELTIDKVPYGGWPNCYRISNGEVELIVTSDIGPRIMRYGFVGGQNLFKEYPETLGKSGEPEWVLRGGHRIWAAPESHPRTYAPDNGPVEIHISKGVLESIQPVEPTTGLEKRILVELDPASSRVKVTHRLRNTLAWPIEFAPWALTMMAQNGVGISGFPPRGKHPDVLPPTHPLVMWAFSDLTDPRWTFTRKYLVLRQDPNNAEPTKLGHFNPHTWAAYLLGSDLFLKQTFNDPSLEYADRGCSFETFTRNDMLELETLGPLQTVEPGAFAEHVEYWSLHRDVAIAKFSDKELDETVLPLLQA
jgi:hypothetical protein